MVSRKTLLSALIFALIAIPSLAFACPYCAQQDQGSVLGKALVIGALVFFPFAVVGFAIPAIRRAGETPPDSEELR